MASRNSSDNSTRENFKPCSFCNKDFSIGDEMHKHLVECGSKTKQCTRCEKYVSRSVYYYHIDNKCADLKLDDEEANVTERISSLNIHENASDQQRTSNSEKFDSLFETVTDVHLNLHENYYPIEVTHVAEKTKFNVIVMGSPRVGKSTLINAFCNGEQSAPTSSSLDSCTKEIKCYILKDNQQRHPNVKPFQVNFYDTPGIESWTNQAGKMTMTDFIKKTDPVCMIYCASPGSYANLPQLHSILQYCQQNGIFCALVCTDMWSGNKRHQVIEEFENQVKGFGDKTVRPFDQPHPPSPHNVSFFGKKALCTMVNSFVYTDNELFGSQEKPVRGVDELIQGIMEALDHEKLMGWCYAVLERRSFWTKLSQNINGFAQQRWIEFQRITTELPKDIATDLINYLHKIISQK